MKLDRKIFIVAIVAAGILGYAYYRTADLMRGPRIFVIAPENGASFASNAAEIQGTIENAALFTINGRPALVDAKGAFNETILLAVGYNAIELYAEDKFGRTSIKQLEVVRK